MERRSNGANTKAANVDGLVHDPLVEQAVLALPSWTADVRDWHTSELPGGALSQHVW
jgi:hypothetical protein